MGLPTLSIFVQDNGLGQALPGNGNTEFVIGGASTGPFYQVIQSTNPAAFAAAGAGPGTELAGFVANSTGNAVAFVPIPITGGANTALAANAPGGSAAPSLTGTPLDTFYGRAKIVTAGTVGAAGSPPQVAVSLDNWRTTFNTYNIPSGGVVAITSTTGYATGLTLTFSGALVVGDSWSWTSTEGVWTTASVQSAINALLPIPSLVPEDIIVAGGSAARTSGNAYTTPGAGFPGTVGVQPADCVVIDGYMANLFNKKRYNGCILQAGDANTGGASTETEAQWMTSLETNFASFVSGATGRPPQVGVTAGHYNVVSPYTQTQFRRPLLWPVSARDSAVAIQVKWGRRKDGALGNLPNSPPTVADGFIYHDEYVSPGLDAARFTSAMSSSPLIGFFVANDNLMCQPGSDFNWYVHLHVINAMCLVGVNFFTTELSDSVRVNSAGTILPVDAADIQTRANAELANVMVNSGAMSSATCIVSLTDNILQTATLSVTFSGQPLGYVQNIPITVTFTNVAAVVVGGT